MSDEIKIIRIMPSEVFYHPVTGEIEAIQITQLKTRAELLKLYPSQKEIERAKD